MAERILFTHLPQNCTRMTKLTLPNSHTFRPNHPWQTALPLNNSFLPSLFFLCLRTKPVTVTLIVWNLLPRKTNTDFRSTPFKTQRSPLHPQPISTILFFGSRLVFANYKITPLSWKATQRALPPRRGVKRQLITTKEILHAEQEITPGRA